MGACAPVFGISGAVYLFRQSVSWPHNYIYSRLLCDLPETIKDKDSLNLSKPLRMSALGRDFNRSLRDSEMAGIRAFPDAQTRDFNLPEFTSAYEETADY